MKCTWQLFRLDFFSPTNYLYTLPLLSLCNHLNNILADQIRLIIFFIPRRMSTNATPSPFLAILKLQKIMNSEGHIKVRIINASPLYFSSRRASATQQFLLSRSISYFLFPVFKPCIEYPLQRTFVVPRHLQYECYDTHTYIHTFFRIPIVF